jgi:hypothetical protein
MPPSTTRKCPSEAGDTMSEKPTRNRISARVAEDMTIIIQDDASRQRWYASKRRWRSCRRSKDPSWS